MAPHLLLRTLRLKQGRTQSQLASLAGVSLPTIQKIEAGSANPGWSVVESILESLGYEVRLAPRAPEWHRLAQFGVPLSSQAQTKKKLSRTDMIDALKTALIYGAHEGFLRTREWEATAAFLLGLKTHFPAVWADLGPLQAEAETLMGMQDVGRLLKLRRISIAFQARYL